MCFSRLQPCGRPRAHLNNMCTDINKKGLNLPKYEAGTDEELEDMGYKYIYLKSRGWLLKGR